MPSILAPEMCIQCSNTLKDSSLQELSLKVAMLMAPAHADRCSDLAALDLEHVQAMPIGTKLSFRHSIQSP